MSKEVVAEVIALIELGLIAPEDIVKCLRKANSEPAQQEPVAVVDDTGVIVVCSYKYKPGDKLYTSPPAQRTWVRLTMREIEWCFADANDDCVVAARNIEAKLKEKNT